MDFDIDLNDIDPDRVGTGGGAYFPPNGKFHVQVDDWQEYSEKNGQAASVSLQCLASTLDNMEGKTHIELFWKTDKAKSRLLQLALACRLVTREELKRQKESTGKATIPWENINGRQLMVFTGAREHEGKTYSDIGFDIYDVDDPKAKDCPKNQGFLEKFYEMTGGQRVSRASNGQSSQQPQQTQPAASGNNDVPF